MSAASPRLNRVGAGPCVHIVALDRADLGHHGCEALIVACYPWHIGDWRPQLADAVNFHCSPLPEGRGAYPLHRAILEGRTSWFVTCHQTAPVFDQGDISVAEHFPLQPDECHESLDLKIQMAARRLAGRVAGSIWRSMAQRHASVRRVCLAQGAA